MKLIRKSSELLPSQEMHRPDPIMPTWVDVKNAPRIIHTDSGDLETGDLETGVMSVTRSRKGIKRKRMQR